jgi:hypothetical protein
MKHTTDKFIYFASPYSHSDKSVRLDRYHKALTVTASYLKAGKVIYSPIVHCHELALIKNMPTDAAFWWRYNRAMLSQAGELWLLTLDGWQQSKGMRKESLYAIQHEIPISYISYAEVLETL